MEFLLAFPLALAALIAGFLYLCAQWDHLECKRRVFLSVRRALEGAPVGGQRGVTILRTPRTLTGRRGCALGVEEVKLWNL